jgi:hypothetical protein
MKLKKPNISKGPWIYDNAPDGFDISDADGNWIATVYGGRDEDEHEATAITALPEVMNRLEWIHELLSEEKSHPMTVHELEQTMLKMGYTKEEES